MVSLDCLWLSTVGIAQGKKFFLHQTRFRSTQVWKPDKKFLNEHIQISAKGATLCINCVLKYLLLKLMSVIGSFSVAILCTL
jgi:hypothetical protein